MNLSADNLIFFAGAFLAPVILVALNFAVRGIKKWYYTAGSDFLFTEMTFSFASAILWKDMSAYMHNEFIQKTANTIFIVMGLVLLICWYWTVSRVESEINNAIRRKLPATALPQGKIFVAWAMAVSFFAVQVMAFAYR